MLQKIVSNLKKKRAPLTPTQGKRLEKRTHPDESTTFTIKGQGRPGFFVLFGSMFAVMPNLFLLSFFFGFGQISGGTVNPIFFVLFMTPFFLVGNGTLLLGLFLWLGKTTLHLAKTKTKTELTRKLFGRTFSRKTFTTPELSISLVQSHESNNVQIYKIRLRDQSIKSGLGGSLKEPELLWLHEQISETLNLESAEISDVASQINAAAVDSIKDTSYDPSYTSKQLTFIKSTYGQKIKITGAKLKSFLGIMSGGIFLLFGLFTIDTPCEWLLKTIPALQKLIGDRDWLSDVPLLFSLAFGLVGLFFVISSSLSLIYRGTIQKKGSRLHIERNWLIYRKSHRCLINELRKVQVAKSSPPDSTPHYRLYLILKSDQEITLASFLAPEDAGQLYASINHIIESSQP